jgi:hypothetical protein
MPETPEKPVGRVVRDPALRADVVGREAREGEFEVSAQRTGDWTSSEVILPSRAKATQIHSALKNALIKQLEAERATLGDVEEFAIHGKTGISTLEEQVAIDHEEGRG